ncbi:hypothetical protein SERLA73DRAFT_86992 [Serpula lacrymans var. lacrymans S7.3]|uniref:Uncharacterized protein n=2 Tax=Serpula lacrymans var. lacrymans TaxID=341189 RepID=F8PSC8_SERL3|nr:hypothetical protein SERLA73DRAFT_86992 [Serpula lacrymans var. lacrymans S7.3]
MSTCSSEPEIFTTVLTVGLTSMLLLSFGSQHYKIISTNLSLGFSPWFLLLGAVSSTGTLLDIWMLQWDIVKCCKQVSAGVCITSLGGVFQVSLQWLLFNITFVLFLIYYPSDMKYVKVDDSEAHGDLIVHSTLVKSLDWRHSILCAWLTVAHFIVSLIYTAYLITTSHASPETTSPPPQIAAWAAFLGISSAGAAILQYLPQLWRTWSFGFVGAISIAMYCFQVPAAAVMVVSIALREGTDWTSWAMYAASGTMASVLLLMCFAWKVRQARLGVDDFGRPVTKAGDPIEDDDAADVAFERSADVVDEQTPLLDAAPASEEGGHAQKGPLAGWWGKK